MTQGLKNEELKRLVEENIALDKKIEDLQKRIDDELDYVNKVTLDQINKRMQEACREVEVLEKQHVADLEKAKASILRSEKFVFDNKEYNVTPKTKKVLIELEKHKEPVTAKDLAKLVEMSETYIRHTLDNLKNRGLPIASQMVSGKRFWAFVKNEDKIQGNNSDIIRISPELIIHAIYLFAYYNGRPPTTSDLASQLKLDVIFVKNELSKLESQGKVKSTKVEINGKRIKAWHPIVAMETNHIPGFSSFVQ